MIAERPTTSEETAAPPGKGEAARLGRVIYERVRAQYDTPENYNKCLIIQVNTGECEMVEMQDLARRLHELHELEPGTRRYLVRNGHATFFRRHHRPRKVVVRW